jgi:hypothetical protein
MVSRVMARAWIDDLPSIGVSRLRASGAIGAQAQAGTVWFGDISFNVAVTHRRFPNGGDWAFFLCPCGHRARTLRLYEGDLGCKGCLEARGLRYRVEDLSKSERARHVASRLKARLTSDAPARLHPREGRVLDRRSRLAAASWRAEYLIARREFGGLADGVAETEA